MIDPPRLKISPRLEALMNYPKFAGPAPRMLVLESQYWLDAACVHAARRLGWSVETVPTRMEGALPREALEQWLTALGAFKPDFVLSINLSGMDTQGLFARLLEDLRVPMAAWFVDDPRTILMGRTDLASPYTAAFTWERAYAPYLEAAGFGLAAWLPLAADLDVFEAAPADDCPRPPSFVGNSMRAVAQTHWAPLAQQPALAAAVRAAFDAGRVTRTRFAEGMDAVLGVEVDAALDAEQRRHAELYCFVEGTRRLREALALRLAPEGLAVHGDEGWGEVVADAARGPVHYVRELPAHYRETCVNLNTTSVQMAAAVNQRVFDCPAAGGLLLTDAQGDLAALFEPGEAAAYANLDECADMLRFYRNRPAARRAMTQKARETVLARHTYAHRLETMAHVLAARYA